MKYKMKRKYKIMYVKVEVNQQISKHMIVIDDMITVILIVKVMIITQKLKNE